MEQWKDVVGYEGLYEVSNLGRVRSVDRQIKYKDSYRTVKGIYIQQLYEPYGHLFVRLCKEGKKKQMYVHRLVAQAFIPNPDNLPCINHKNEIPDDNRVENLEWCTVTYNNTYGKRIEKEIMTKIKNGKYNPLHIGLPAEEQRKLFYKEHREEINRKRRIRYLSKVGRVSPPETTL